jgi:hypothetical protein
MKRVLTALVFGAVLAGLLGGGASSRLVNSDVTSFARWTPAPPAPGSSYRFERLPSQQAPNTAQLEGLAQAALAKVGLQHNPQAPTFSVQITALTQPILRSNWDGGYGAPFGGSGLSIGTGFGFGSGGGSSVGIGFGFPLGGRMDPALYRRDLSLIIRDIRSNAVVYETRAISEDPWGDSTPVIAAMLDAALRGFPVPPAGTQRVSIEIPR